MPSASASGRKSLFARPAFAAIAVCVVVGIVQLRLTTDGIWISPSRYYASLTDAFLHGQLSLRLKPPPQLLALPDPYDPIANRPYRLHDAVLFDGKYYLYFGPVPALIGAAGVLALGIDASDYCDQQLVFAFMFGIVVLAMVLIWQVRWRLFPGLKGHNLLPPLLTLALGAPLLTCTGVYGAAILGGQLFLLAGLCCAWFGFERRKGRALWMLAAGICWALSCGSRISLPPAVATLAILTAWQLRRIDDSAEERPSPVPAIAAMIVPLLAGMVLMGWYNFARFHSVTDFGYRYELAAFNQHAAPASQMVSAGYVIPNLERYLLEAPRWSGQFPFLLATGHDSPSAMDKSFNFPPVYTLDPLVGLVWTQPFLLLAIAGVIAALRHPAFPAATSTDRQRGRWLVASLSAATVLGFASPVVLAASAYRFLVDALPSAAILAAIGYFWILNISGNWRRSITIAAGIVVFVQCVVGILAEIDNHKYVTGMVH